MPFQSSRASQLDTQKRTALEASPKSQQEAAANWTSTLFIDTVKQFTNQQTEHLRGRRASASSLRLIGASQGSDLYSSATSTTTTNRLRSTTVFLFARSDCLRPRGPKSSFKSPVRELK